MLSSPSSFGRFHWHPLRKQHLSGVRHWSLLSVQVKLIKMGGPGAALPSDCFQFPRCRFLDGCSKVLDRIGRLSPAPS